MDIPLNIKTKCHLPFLAQLRESITHFASAVICTVVAVVTVELNHLFQSHEKPPLQQVIGLRGSAEFMSLNDFISEWGRGVHYQVNGQARDWSWVS